MFGGARRLGNMVGLGMALFFVSPGFPAVLDFSDVVQAGTYHEFFGQSFQSMGFTFTTTSLDNVVDSATYTNALRTPVDGHSVFVVQVLFGLGGGGSFAPTAGGAFALTSLDAVYWTDFAPNIPKDFSITGHFTDGTTQSVNGVVNPGSFDPLVLNWTDLGSVSFTASGGFGWFALGNINVQTDAPANVPEGGSSLWLAMTAALAMGCRVRRHWA